MHIVDDEQQRPLRSGRVRAGPPSPTTLALRGGNRIRVLETTRGTEQAAFAVPPNSDYQTSFTLSHDGKLLANLQVDEIALRDVQTGSALTPIKKVRPQRAMMSSPVFTPDGRITITTHTVIASPSSIETMRMWDVRSGRLLTESRHEDDSSGIKVQPPHVSSDGRSVLSSPGMGRVEIPTGRRIRRQPGPPFIAADISSQGVAANPRQGKIYLWEVDTGRAPIGPVVFSCGTWPRSAPVVVPLQGVYVPSSPPHSVLHGYVAGMAFSADGSLLHAIDSHGNLRSHLIRVDLHQTGALSGDRTAEPQRLAAVCPRCSLSPVLLTQLAHICRSEQIATGSVRATYPAVPLVWAEGRLSTFGNSRRRVRSSARSVPPAPVLRHRSVWPDRRFFRVVLVCTASTD